MRKNRITQNVNIIKAVKQRPALWDYSHPLNSDKKIKEQLWSEIAKKVKLNVFDVEARWDDLKENFTKNLMTSTLLEDKYEDPDSYECSWRYFKDLFFLKDTLKQQLNENKDSHPLSSDNRDISHDFKVIEVSHDAFLHVFPINEEIKKTYAERQDAVIVSSLFPIIKHIPPHKKAKFMKEAAELIEKHGRC